jgi:hypothetical protein
MTTKTFNRQKKNNNKEKKFSVTLQTRAQAERKSFVGVHEKSTKGRKMIFFFFPSPTLVIDNNRLH